MKEPAKTQPPSDPQLTEELDREIGMWGAASLGVGTMIAAGIFVLSGLAVSNVGAAAILAFGIAALVASFTAAAYAEFAAIYPESGGGYMYVANVFESDATYLVGWAMILGYPASAAFYLASFSDWFYRFVYPALHLSEAIPYWISGLVILGLLVAVNAKGTKETGLFQIVVTALKVLLILVFLYGGLQAFDGDVVAASFAEHAGRLRDIGLTSALVFITFFGFEAIATNAEEIDAPGRTVPRAIFFSMGFVTVVYALVVLVVVLAVNDSAFLSFLVEKAGLEGPEEARRFVAENGELSMGRAAQYYLGDVGFYVIIVGALFSMISAANATIMAGSRVKLAMARRSHLPAAIERIHPTTRTPLNAVMLTGGLICLFMMTFGVLFGGEPGAVGGHDLFGLHLGLEGLAHFADFMLLTGLIFVNLAIITSRKRSPDIERPFRVPGVPWVPILAVVANLALLVNVELTALMLGLGAQAAGALFWFAWKRAPGERREEVAPTAVAEFRTRGKEPRILVPVANPEHVDQLVRTAASLARDRGGEILAIGVVTVPDQTPLSEGRRYADQKREVLERALEVADQEGVGASGLIRIAHHAADAILHTIDEHDVHMALLGWTGRPHRRQDVVLGTTVDRVIREASCDVLVERIEEDGRGGIDSILVPTAGGPHARRAAEIAASLARIHGARLRLVNVVSPGTDRAERERSGELLAGASRDLEELAPETRVLEGDDVASTLVEASADHDLTVIGATREGLLQQLLFGDIPHAVGERAHGRVIMVKAGQGVASRLKRWLQWR